MNDNGIRDQAHFLRYKIIESAKKTKRIMVAMVIVYILLIGIVAAVYLTEGLPEGENENWQMIILILLGFYSVYMIFSLIAKPEESRRNYYIRELFIDLRNVDSKTAISYAEAQLQLIQTQIEMQSTFIDERQVSLQEYYHSVIVTALADQEDIKKEWKKVIDAMYLWGRYR